MQHSLLHVGIVLLTLVEDIIRTREMHVVLPQITRISTVGVDPFYPLVNKVSANSPAIVATRVVIIIMGITVIIFLVAKSDMGALF